MSSSNEKRTMNRGRRSAHGIVLLTTIALTLVLGVSGASAIKLHPASPTASLGPDGTPGTSFLALRSIAFQQATKRLYVMNLRNQPSPAEIYGFDTSSPGAFSLVAPFDPLTMAEPIHNSVNLTVDNTSFPTAGNVYYAQGGVFLGEPFPNEFDFNRSKLFGFAPSGVSLSGWPIEPPKSQSALLKDAAVDPTTGNVWVSDLGGPSGDHIRRYTASGTALPLLSTAPREARSIAIDSNGDVYFEGLFDIYKMTAPGYATSTKFIENVALNSQLAVDPKTHDLYVAEGKRIRRFNSSGALLEEFATSLPSMEDIALDPASGDVYVGGQDKVYLFPGIEFPLPTTGVASNPAATSATLNGTVRPDGLALTDCRFEYVTEGAFQATGFSDLSSGGSLPCTPAAGSIPADSSSHPVDASVSGLSPATAYRFRLLAANVNGTTPGQTASFQLGKPLLETTGSPLRTTTTAHLEGRLFPHGLPTSYRFEYGSEGPCDTNPCSSTESHPGGAGSEFEFVSEAIEGLSPATTYHYRLLADNGSPDSPAIGADMTLTTRASDAPLAHGRFPGPPGSDRAWEQVSLPDSSGNPISQAYAVSDDGNRAFYQVFGGTRLSPTGGVTSVIFAERTAAGWRSSNLFPPRDQLVGSNVFEPAGRSDLADQAIINRNAQTYKTVILRLRPGQPGERVYEEAEPEDLKALLVSADGSRILALLRGSPDPVYPGLGKDLNLYDITSGSPRLVGLLPDGSVPPCGASASELLSSADGYVARVKHWISADGSRAFFKDEPCTGPDSLYMRDFSSEQTALLSGPPLSGPSCAVRFLKSNADAAFFFTATRLSPDDVGIAGCSDSDVYRHDLAGGSPECLTCGIAALGGDADVIIAADGSRLYFTSPKLLPGAPATGSAIYRLDVATGELAYVAPFASLKESAGAGTLTPDGSALVFVSSDVRLNPLGGQSNGATPQFYRYDDRDRSLTCLSCPQDGSRPLSSPKVLDEVRAGANKTNLSADGRIFAFQTPTPLLPADQNTARPGQDPSVGSDVYEWRDGRLLLISDGLTEWSFGSGPRIEAITPSGDDIFFTAPAQYTPDALDSFVRLYDARIGGGIDFPAPPPPCPLEVCQGTPKGAPEEPPPGTSSFRGPGNPTAKSPRCPKGKVRKRGRCIKQSAGRKHRKHGQRNHRRTTGPTGGAHR